jgi:hypothetical protein
MASSSPEVIEWSLFTDLTKGSGNSFPATDSVKELLQSICNCVCDLKRNTQIAYRFAKGAADIYVSINALIKTVEMACDEILQVDPTLPSGDEAEIESKESTGFKTFTNSDEQNASPPFGKTSLCTPLQLMN